jgi:NADH-quinone oxidoreductase subunit C
MNASILQKLSAFSPDSILGHEEFRGDLAVTIRRDDIFRVCTFLKNDPDLAFAMAVDVTAVDYYRPEDRFEVVYHL